MKGLTFLFTTYGLNVGGAENILLNVANRLADRGHRVYCVSLSKENELSIHFSKSVALFQVPRKWKYDLSPILGIRRIVFNVRPMVVISLDPFDYFFLNMALTGTEYLQKTKVYVSVHRTYPESLKDRYQTFFFLKFPRHPLKIIALTPTHARILQKIYNLPPAIFKVIPNGIDVTKFSPDILPESKTALRKHYRLPEDALIFIMVANFTLPKDHENAIRAMSIIKSMLGNPNFHLVFVGGGEKLRIEKLKKFVFELGLIDRIHFVGPQKDVRPFYKLADYFTLSSYTEAFPVAILEAMAMGLPVIVTNVGGNKDIVPDFTGILVPPSEPESLANAWIEASKRKWDRNKIRNYVVTNYSLEKIVDKYETLVMA